MVGMFGGSQNAQSWIKNVRTNNGCPIAIRDILRALPADEANKDYFGPDAMAIVFKFLNPAINEECIKKAVLATKRYRKNKHTRINAALQNHSGIVEGYCSHFDGDFLIAKKRVEHLIAGFNPVCEETFPDKMTLSEAARHMDAHYNVPPARLVQAFHAFQHGLNPPKREHVELDHAQAVDAVKRLKKNGSVREDELTRVVQENAHLREENARLMQENTQLRAAAAGAMEMIETEVDPSVERALVIYDPTKLTERVRGYVEQCEAERTETSKMFALADKIAMKSTVAAKYQVRRNAFDNGPYGNKITRMFCNLARKLNMSDTQGYIYLYFAERTAKFDPIVKFNRANGGHQLMQVIADVKEDKRDLVFLRGGKSEDNTVRMNTADRWYKGNVDLIAIVPTASPKFAEARVLSLTKEKAIHTRWDWTAMERSVAEDIIKNFQWVVKGTIDDDIFA